MPMLEINATQPEFVSQLGNVVEITGKFGDANQLRIAVIFRRITLRNHPRRTRDLLLPRLLSGQVNLAEN